MLDIRTHEDLFQSYWENLKEDKYVSVESIHNELCKALCCDSEEEFENQIRLICEYLEK